MAFDWREYLALARFVEGQTSSGFSAEAARRCAVSRAYYAAFCHARNYAQAHYGFIPQGGPQDHGDLRKHMQQQGQGKVARQLSQLRQWRNQCDYDDVVPNLTTLCASALTEAGRVIIIL